MNKLRRRKQRARRKRAVFRYKIIGKIPAGAYYAHGQSFTIIGPEITLS